MTSLVLSGHDSLDKSLRDLDKVDQIALRLASLPLPLPLPLPLFVLDLGIEFQPSGNVYELSELRGMNQVSIDTATFFAKSIYQSMNVLSLSLLHWVLLEKSIMISHPMQNDCPMRLK